MYGPWDMVRDRRTDRQTDQRKKWHIEVGAPPKNQKQMIMSTWVEAHQKFDFSIQQSWFF